MDFAKACCPECHKQMQPTEAECPSCQITLRGRFELSPLAQLTPEQQVFVMAFLRAHGSLKALAEQFEISYPTVKNRLNLIVDALDQSFTTESNTNEQLLEQLASGELNVEQVLGRMR